MKLLFKNLLQCFSASRRRVDLADVERRVDYMHESLERMSDLTVDHLEVTDGVFEFRGSTQNPKILQYIAMTIAQQMHDEHAPNYYEQTIQIKPRLSAEQAGAEPIDIIVTFQKPGKLTPGAKAAMLQTRLDALTTTNESSHD